MDDDVVRMYLRLPMMRDEYLRKISKLAVFQQAGLAHDVQKQLKDECWKIRAEAYRVLVKALDSGCDERALESEANAFSWSLEQLDSEALREWLVALYFKL